MLQTTGELQIINYQISGKVKFTTKLFLTWNLLATNPEAKWTQAMKINNYSGAGAAQPQLRPDLCSGGKESLLVILELLAVY
jgi:hypothetical protein